MPTGEDAAPADGHEQRAGDEHVVERVGNARVSGQQVLAAADPIAEQEGPKGLENDYAFRLEVVLQPPRQLLFAALVLSLAVIVAGVQHGLYACRQWGEYLV